MAVLPLQPDGSLQAPTDSKHHAMPDPDSGRLDRQEAAHPHQIRQDPLGRILVPDLGLDTVFVYSLTPSGGLQGPQNAACHYRAPPGSGPRHLDWSPPGAAVPCVYVLLELSCEVSVLALETLEELQRVSSLPEGVKGSRASRRASPPEVSRWPGVSLPPEAALLRPAVAAVAHPAERRSACMDMYRT